MSATTLASAARTDVACDTTPAQRVTRSLLGYGVIAGPIYVTTSVVQALAHDGFDLSRHAWSQLGAGPQGWIQMANLVLTGAMGIAFAVGLRRCCPSRWTARLIMTFGLGMVAAGLLVADPALGYPVGVATPATPTWHGIGHFVSSGIGFAALIIATFVLARSFARSGARRLTWWVPDHRHRLYGRVRRRQQRRNRPGRHPALRRCRCRGLGMAGRSSGARLPLRDQQRLT